VKLSVRNIEKLHAAIHEPIAAKRIAVKNADGMIHRRDLDELLSNLNNEIWKEVRMVLDIKG
jgi:hypothetical protein